jgi:hypothetical protein
MTGVGRRRVWVEQCLHAPGTSDRPHDGSPLLAAELVPSIATQDGTVLALPRATTRSSPMRCPTSAHVACQTFPPRPLREKVKSASDGIKMNSGMPARVNGQA